MDWRGFLNQSRDSDGSYIRVAGGVLAGPWKFPLILNPDHPGYHSFHRRKNTEICWCLVTLPTQKGKPFVSGVMWIDVFPGLLFFLQLLWSVKCMYTVYIMSLPFKNVLAHVWRSQGVMDIFLSKKNCISHMVRTEIKVTVMFQVYQGMSQSVQQTCC